MSWDVVILALPPGSDLRIGDRVKVDNSGVPRDEKSS